ncbi:MAG: mercury methylation corrinoid protein HgcA [Kiritimatiellia bacterium]
MNETAPIFTARSEWTLRDHLGALGVRLNWRRMRHRVTPGLYALGAAGLESPVFVSANYKLSFNYLRRSLGGMDAWILVLDTAGINVWCAAGKGTFGTEELVRRIEACGLRERVAHRRLVVPQLGAPGIAAHEVKKQSGFAVVYGPVDAADIPAFIKAGMKATTGMRRVRFNWRDRLAVAPLELVIHFNRMLFVGVLLALLAGVTGWAYSGSAVRHLGGPALLLWLASYVAAGLLGPLLLPWLPSRVFSVKGAVLGLGLGLLGVWLAVPDWSQMRGAGWLLLVTAGASHLLLNYTGSTTFTSPSGVRREVRAALPVQIALGVIGLLTWTLAR